MHSVFLEYIIYEYENLINYFKIKESSYRQLYSGDSLFWVISYKYLI